ncbi:MAG: MBG domain-containing protein, partial [Vicinamibacterales bacterium]
LTGDLDRAPGTDVGTYAIGQGTLAASANYTLTYVGANLTITAKPIEVTANAQTKVYGEADPALTWTITSGTLESGDSLTGDLDRAPGTDVGTYAIGQGTLAASANYTLTYVGANLTITAKPITVTANAQTKVYGEADPALTWSITSGSLESGDSLTGDLDRAPGTDVGTYAIGQGTLAASSNYSLTYVGANLTITAKPIEVTANAQTKVYGEADPALTWTITSGPLESGDSLTGDLDRAPGTDVGTYAIGQGTLAASANYTLTYVGANLTITAKPITVTADAKSKVYGEADPTLTWSVTSGTLESGDSLTGDLDRAPGANVGTYAINQNTLAASSNYTLTYVGANLTITAKPIEVTANAQTKVYGEADPTLTWSITSGSLESGDSLTGDLDRAPGTDVGTYAINQGTLAASANYTLTYVGANLTITAKALTVTADDASKVYGDTVTFTGSEFTTAGLFGSDSVTGVTLASAGAGASANAGSYPIAATAAVGTGLANYDITYVDGTLDVAKKPVVIGVPDVNVPYDGTPKGAVCTISDGLVGTVTYTGNAPTIYGPSATAPTEAGNYTVTCEFPGDPNHEGPVTETGIVTITPAPLTVTANDASKVYGDTVTFAGTEFTTAGLFGSDSVASVTLASAGAGAAANAGTYPIAATAAVGTGLGNYTISYVDGTLDVAKKPVVIGVPDVNVPYDGTPKGAVCTISDGLAGTVTYTGNAPTVYGPSASAPTEAGNYTVTCEFPGDPNHEGPVTETGIVTITPVPATVTAGSGSKVEDEVDPTLGTTSTGFLAADLTDITLETTRDAGEAPGTYDTAATATGAPLANYTVSYVPGTFTIDAKRLDVTADAICIADTPYVSFNITAANFTPVNGATATIEWIDSLGNTVRTDVLPWTNTSQPLTGQLLWPGAVVDGNGQPVDWPGWLLQDGLWIQGSDGYENTRPTSTVRISVNPTTEVTVNYPPPTPNCNAAPPENQPPVAVDDPATTPEDTPVTISVTDNDTDPEDGPLTVTVPSTTTPNGGTLVVTPGGAITYTPADDFCGTDTFTYTITDAAGLTDTATVTVNVTCVNDPPVANDDTAATTENTPAVIVVKGNDSDPDGDPLTVSLLTPPVHGGAVVNPDGTVTYTPTVGYCGADTFSYRVTDAGGLTDTATVTVAVACVNDPPDAVDDTTTAVSGTPLTITVLSNDTDPENDPLTVTTFTQPTAGTVTKVGNQLVYTPPTWFSGTVTFTYTVSDGKGGTDTATVTVQVSGYGEVCYIGTGSQHHDGDGCDHDRKRKGHYDGDGDAHDRQKVSAKQEWRSNPDGTITIRTTLSRNFVDNTYGSTQIGWPGNNHRFKHLVDSDMIQLALYDANGSRKLEFRLDYFSEVSGTPSGYGNTGVTGRDGAMVYGSASKIVGSDSSLARNFNQFGYVLTSNSPATDANYTPNPGYPNWIYEVWYEVTVKADAFGTAGFGHARIVTMHASPSKTGNETEPLAVTACAPSDPGGNQPPVAVNDTATTEEETPVTVTVLANDFDADGDTLTVTGVTGNPARATVTANPGGTVTYTPVAGFSGTDTFTYTVDDGHGGTATATVTVTVTRRNHSPVANNDAATTDKNKYVKIPVLANDSDPDNDTLSIANVSSPAHGTASVSGSQIRYTPNRNFTGTDTFTYTIADGQGGTATATVTVTVGRQNRPPVAVFDTATTEKNKYVKVSVLSNDSDPDGDDLSITGVTQGAHGSVTIYGSQVKYTPATNYTGTDTFTYTISDGNGGTATATVTVTVVKVHSDNDDCRSHKGHRDHDGNCPDRDDHHDDHYPGDRDGCRDWSRNNDWDWGHDRDDRDHDDRNGHDDRDDRNGHDDRGGRNGHDDRGGSDRDDNRGHYSGDRDGCRDYSRNGSYSFGNDRDDHGSSSGGWSSWSGYGGRR